MLSLMQPSLLTCLLVTHLLLLVIVAGERVGQSLQRGVGVAGERRHGRDQDDAFRQADDQRRGGEAHHAAHVNPARAETAHQATHDQGEEGWGSTLQEEAQAAHTNTWEVEEETEEEEVKKKQWAETFPAATLNCDALKTL